MLGALARRVKLLTHISPIMRPGLAEADAKIGRARIVGLRPERPDLVELVASAGVKLPVEPSQDRQPQAFGDLLGIDGLGEKLVVHVRA